MIQIFAIHTYVYAFSVSIWLKIEKTKIKINKTEEDSHNNNNIQIETSSMFDQCERPSTNFQLILNLNETHLKLDWTKTISTCVLCLHFQTNTLFTIHESNNQHIHHHTAHFQTKQCPISSNKSSLSRISIFSFSLLQLTQFQFSKIEMK